MAKKKILFQSDFSLIKTGFARNAKALLSYLYKTGKYDIVHYCCGMDEKSPELLKTPWKSVGCLPNSQEKRAEISRDPKLNQILNYGAFFLDDVIQREKPDIYMAVQDVWGVDFAVNKHWFNKINSVIWTTLDSLPLLPNALRIAPKVKNYWIWSDFATKEMHRLGHDHVKTMHGIIETDNFFRLSPDKRKSLRDNNNIDEDAFVVGYVFRNQLRKSVPNLIEGFKIFRKNNPDIKKTKLLLHTDFREGWDIKRLADEHGIDWGDILTTHICSKCFRYEMRPFTGINQDCRLCGSKQSVNTTGVGLGVTEPQLNEVYNFMDVYCHPFTSGGQEIPIQESKLTELITLVTDYSCGEEMCKKEANSLPLKWSEYREFGTNFIKASTDPNDIAVKLANVYRMEASEREKMGKNARQWVLDNFSVESVGNKIEEFLGSCASIDKDNYPKPEQKDPDIKIPDNENITEWIKSLYSLILKTEVGDNDDGFKYWLSEVKKGVPKESIENYFRNVARKENLGKIEKKLHERVSQDDGGKRILYVMPENEEDVYVSTSLFESIKSLYPDHNLYVATDKKYFGIINSNPYIHSLLEYNKEMDNPENLVHESERIFDVVYTPHLNKHNYKFIKKTVNASV